MAEMLPTSRVSMPPLVMFGADVCPLPFSTRICLPSRVNTAPVGYHPVGTKPLTNACVELLTSTTATAFRSAFETTSVEPSGDSASEFGVDVGGSSGYRPTAICSIGWKTCVSNDQTESWLAHATKRRRPSFDSVIAFGCASVSSDVTNPRVSLVNTSTLVPPQIETNTYLPSAETAAVYGSADVVTVFVTWPDGRSIADNDVAKRRVTNSVRPSRLIVSPPANVSPVAAGSANVRPRVSVPSLANASSWTLFCAAPPT